MAYRQLHTGKPEVEKTQFHQQNIKSPKKVTVNNKVVYVKLNAV